MNGALWLVALPLVLSPLAYFAGRTQLRVASARREAPSIAAWLSLLIIAVAWIPFVWLVRDFRQNGATIVSVGAISLQVDGFGLLLAGLALFLGLITAVYSIPGIAGRTGEEKYYASLIVMIGAMAGLAFSIDLFNLWVWFETMLVSSYLLVTFYRDGPASLEASVKYLVQSAAGSAFVLVGIALILAETGTLDITAIRQSAETSWTMVAAGALFLTGFGIKTALVPLHTWLPDVYSRAPTGISAIFSGVVTQTGLFALLRVLSALAGVSLSWGIILMTLATVNILLGNLMALGQTDVRRMLAYSSVSHIGYMLLGLGISVQTGVSAGAQGGLFHLLNHGLMKALAFFAVGALLHALTFDDSKPATFDDLSGMARRAPLAALALCLSALGLIGLPPLAGFVSKFQIFGAGLAAQDSVIDFFIIVAALNTVISLGYYLPLVNALFRPEPSARASRPLPLTITGPLVVLAAAVILIGVWPASLTWLTGAAADAVLAAFGS